MIKVIKTDAEHQEALAEIERLIELDPELNTPNGNKLELLALLVQQYESERFPIDLPDPVDAIEFLMEQQGLSQRDLIPYLGSRSKVSEVLNRKRPLTLSMIRALHAGLGLPANILIKEGIQEEDDEAVDWMRFPLKEMIKRGWIIADDIRLRADPAALLREWFASIGGPKLASSGALYRKASHVRSERTMDEYALEAWTARIVMRAREEGSLEAYRRGTVDKDFMQTVVQLSSKDNGPIWARDFLRQHGIALIIEPHLPHTHLDGAAIVYREGDNPVIGLTLRHDRLDNFWFSLMHELAHVARHLDDEIGFYDDLELEEQNDPREQEADQLARETMIPEEVWKHSPASLLRSPVAADELAQQLQVSPAIVAGRMRYEFKAYRLLNNLVGHGEVRRLFTEVKWEK